MAITGCGDSRGCDLQQVPMLELFPYSGLDFSRQGGAHHRHLCSREQVPRPPLFVFRQWGDIKLPPPYVSGVCGAPSVCFQREIHVAWQSWKTSIGPCRGLWLGSIPLHCGVVTPPFMASHSWRLWCSKHLKNLEIFPHGVKLLFFAKHGVRHRIVFLGEEVP